MKNLKLIDTFESAVGINSQSFQVCCGYDGTAEKEVLFVCDSNLNISKHNLNDGSIFWKNKLLESPCEVDVVNMTYLTLPETVTLGLSSGEIWTVRGETGASEEAGACAGLDAMQWSPDQELVVLVTKEKQMILMSYLLDPIADCNLCDEEFGEKGFINVGWGKKETQFHGSEGKQAAFVKNTVSGGETQIDTKVNISWRGDGQMYAVSIVVNGVRLLKIFDRDGHLQYTSEKQSGLDANLAWRPSGNVIATTQNYPNKNVVAFFEKNGLKHGEFTIPGNATVMDLSWSMDSEVISLKCHDIVKNQYSILLFTCSNYHWYLKQSIVFPVGETILQVLWDNYWNQYCELDPSKKLHVFLSSGKRYCYNWATTVDHSRGKDVKDDAVVAVIDGNKLLLTAFRHSVVPPPMSAFQIETSGNINFVLFAPYKDTCDSNSLCVLTDDNQLIFYEQTSKVPLKYESVATVVLKMNEFPLNEYNFMWMQKDVIILISFDNGYLVKEYRINLEEKSVKLLQSTKLDSSVFAIESHPTENSSAFMLTNNDICQYQIGGNLIKAIMPAQGGSVKLNVISVQDKLYFLSVSKNVFSINDKLKLSNNVSSMFVHSDFLLLTTLQHELVCVELTTKGVEALIDSNKLTKDGHIYKRKTERGSKLVVAVPGDTRTVFQLPRGNLEVIQPRPLSLRIIGEFLDRCEYLSAFDLMRKQRINLNLIHDHNPVHFINNVEVFLTQIKNPSWLSLFLSDLENVDVTVTMYASSYTCKTPMLSDQIASKVSTVCEIIRNALEKSSSKEERILPILTTYVKMNTIEDLEEALKVVKEIKMKETNSHKPAVTSEEALRYLLYLVDVNNLYDIALGMYDFDLVLLIATKSQKDPKEYVPLLNEFNEMEENYKRFSINKTLKRFSRAVRCLAQCGPSHHQELKTFVKYHSLFADALQLFKPQDEIYKEIAEDYGLHLKLKKQYSEAGFVYRRGGCIDKAIECYKDALEWELAIVCAQIWPKEKLSELCSELVDLLKEEKRHGEALTILEQYCDEKEKAVHYAAQCGQYMTAVRLCHRCGKEELAESIVKPAIQEEHSNIAVLVRDNTDMFKKRKERLLWVRANKLAKGDCLEVDFAHKDSDLYSDAGSTIASTGSRSSSRSFRSSKNRRKHERKLISLKEGSQYEDVALLNALYNLVSSSFELRVTVKEVTMGLCWFGLDKMAFELQANLDNLLRVMKESFREIWSHEVMLEATNASISAQLDPEGSPQGIAALDLHMRIPPVIQEINWKLSALS